MRAAVVHAFGEPLRIEEVPVPVESLDAINDAFARMEAGRIEGRVVLRP
jgi:D-arabinose 1-dehydrogenase-like Zn-dependent alcohol dehydrogenase